MKLSIQLDLIDGESVSSYVYRLARANFYNSVAPFSKLLSIEYIKILNNDFDEQSIEKLSMLTGIDFDTLFPRSLKWLKDKINFSLEKKLINRSKIKFCPICIDTETHLNMIWSLNPVTICLKHHNFLIDRCSYCECDISLAALIAGHCESCEFPLKDIFSVNISSESYVLKSQIQIFNKIYNQDQENNALEHLTFSELMLLFDRCFHLIEGLPSFIDDKSIIIHAFFYKKGYHPSNLDYAVAFSNVFWMFQNFPLNFHKVLQSFNGKNSDIKYEQKKQFEKLFKLNHKFLFIKDAYNEYWIKQLDQGVVRKDFSVFKDESSLLDRRKFVSKEELKNDRSIPFNQVNDLINNDVLKVHKIHRGEKIHYSIDKELFKNIAHMNQSFVTRKEAANFLGIHVNSIEKLVKANLITPKKAPTNKWKIYLPDIQNFLDNYRGNYDSSNVHCLKLHEVLVKYSVYGLNLVRLLQFISENVLFPITNKRDGNLADLFFREEELQKCINILKKEQIEHKGYFANDVISMLKINERTFRKMNIEGIFIPQKTIVLKNGIKRVLYDKKVIDNFVNNHASVNELSKEYGVFPQKIRKWVREGKISDRAKGLCKGYILNRAEFAEFIKQIS